MNLNKHDPSSTPDGVVGPNGNPTISVDFLDLTPSNDDRLEACSAGAMLTIESPRKKRSERDLDELQGDLTEGWSASGGDPMLTFVVNCRQFWANSENSSIEDAPK